MRPERCQSSVSRAPGAAMERHSFRHGSGPGAGCRSGMNFPSPLSDVDAALSRESPERIRGDGVRKEAGALKALFRSSGGEAYTVIKPVGAARGGVRSPGIFSRFPAHYGEAAAFESTVW